MTVGIRSAWFGQRVGDGIPPATFAGIGRTGACAATVIEVPARRSAALPFAAVGAACIVAGGLVAAVSAPAPSEHASWAAAYLVLVVGAAAQEACSDGAGALTAATSPPATMQAAPTAAKGSAAERRAGTSITVAAQAPVRPMPANVAGGDAVLRRAGQTRRCECRRSWRPLLPAELKSGPFLVRNPARAV